MDRTVTPMTYDLWPMIACYHIFVVLLPNKKCTKFFATMNHDKWIQLVDLLIGAKNKIEQKKHEHFFQLTRGNMAQHVIHFKAEIAKHEIYLWLWHEPEKMVLCKLNWAIEMIINHLNKEQKWKIIKELKSEPAHTWNSSVCRQFKYCPNQIIGKGKLC